MPGALGGHRKSSFIQPSGLTLSRYDLHDHWSLLPTMTVSETEAGAQFTTGQASRNKRRTFPYTEATTTSNRFRIHRLSLFTIFTLLICYIAVPTVIALLCFLWSNPPLTQTHSIWRDLVLGGWTVESITMSTVILRTAVTVSAA